MSIVMSTINHNYTIYIYFVPSLSLNNKLLKLEYNMITDKYF